MDDKETKRSAHERLFKFSLQEEFDVRYVLQDGDYKYVKAVVIGAVGLILTGALVAGLAWVFHSPSL